MRRAASPHPGELAENGLPRFGNRAARAAAPSSAAITGASSARRTHAHGRLRSPCIVRLAAPSRARPPGPPNRPHGRPRRRIRPRSTGGRRSRPGLSFVTYRRTPARPRAASTTRAPHRRERQLHRHVRRLAFGRPAARGGRAVHDRDALLSARGHLGGLALTENDRDREGTASFFRVCDVRPVCRRSPSWRRGPRRSVRERQIGVIVRGRTGWGQGAVPTNLEASATARARDRRLRALQVEGPGT